MEIVPFISNLFKHLLASNPAFYYVKWGGGEGNNRDQAVKIILLGANVNQFASFF